VLSGLRHVARQQVDERLGGQGVGRAGEEHLAVRVWMSSSSTRGVVGIDDIMPTRLGRPKLTTVAMPTVAAGRSAVDMLLQLVGSTEPSGAAQTTLETTLIVRDSTAARPSPAPSPLSRLTR
jgi:hypothetical protein